MKYSVITCVALCDWDDFKGSIARRMCGQRDKKEITNTPHMANTEED
jgi:hypothetical protein